MKKAMFLTVAMIAVSVSAQAANLSGKWSGTGTAVEHKGEKINCESVVLTLAHTATALSVSSDFSCSGTKANIPGGKMEIRGNEIFDKGVKAGTISADTISIVAKEKNFIMQSNASFTDKAMNLRSVISVASDPGTPVLKFEAALKR